jgi:twitching motility two-component system response regulator PilH
LVDRSGRQETTQRKVLLLDRGGDCEAGHRRTLERRGYHVTRTADMDTALMLARQTRPRAIFLTAEGLGSGRTPFLQALRSDDNTRHIPVIILAGGRDASLERLGLSRVARDTD